MKHILYVLAFLFMMAGCGGNGGVPERSEEDRERLTALDDSIMARSPHALEMIANGMRTAGDSVTWYEYYMRHGKYWQLTQDLDSMLPYMHRTRAFVESLPKTPRTNGMKALAYEMNAAYWQRQRLNFDTIVALRTVAYNAMMESDDKDFLPEVCANMADAYVLKSDFSQAASWYRRALFLVDSLALPDIKDVTLYLGLAQIYMALDDYESSLKYYRETGKFYDSMPPNMKVYYLNNFGNYYYYHSEYGNALQQFLRMHDLLVQYGDEGIDMATCRVNLADVYLNLGQPEKARENLDSAENFFVSEDIGIGVYYANTIRIGLAVRYGDKADVRRILAGETSQPPFEYSLMSIRSRYMREYYKSVGDWQAAYNNLERDIALRDSMDNARQHMRASEIMQRLKEDTLSLHHALEMEQKDAKMRNNNIMAAVAVVVAVLVLLLLAAYSRRKRLQTELDMMQLKLDNARNRISPHFIFNVLNRRISVSNAGESDELMMLVKLIRANLNMSRNTFVSLAEEMEFVRYYIDIERTALGDGFEVTVSAPAEDVMRTIDIPSMFVQILVENAIKHGLCDTDGPKRLSIDIVTGAGGTDITVSDNGPGFDIRSASAGGTHTGLDIIRHTIRIINERMKSGGMTFAIKNRDNGKDGTTGCEVRLHVPHFPDSLKNENALR